MFLSKHNISINLLESNWTAESPEHHISSADTLCCRVISIVLAWGGFLPHCETPEWLCLPAGPPSTWRRVEKNRWNFIFGWSVLFALAKCKSWGRVIPHNPCTCLREMALTAEHRWACLSCCCRRDVRERRHDETVTRSGGGSEGGRVGEREREKTLTLLEQTRCRRQTS